MALLGKGNIPILFLIILQDMAELYNMPALNRLLAIQINET